MLSALLVLAAPALAYRPTTLVYNNWGTASAAYIVPNTPGWTYTTRSGAPPAGSWADQTWWGLVDAGREVTARASGRNESISVLGACASTAIALNITGDFTTDAVAVFIDDRRMGVDEYTTDAGDAGRWTLTLNALPRWHNITLVTGADLELRTVTCQPMLDITS
jgi:hypothetical protein